MNWKKSLVEVDVYCCWTWLPKWKLILNVKKTSMKAASEKGFSPKVGNDMSLWLFFMNIGWQK